MNIHSLIKIHLHQFWQDYDVLASTKLQPMLRNNNQGQMAAVIAECLKSSFSGG